MFFNLKNHTFEVNFNKITSLSKDLKFLFSVVILLLFIARGESQIHRDTLFKRISYDLDFRFRIEQDWNSRTSNGSFRENRSRLRYRMRAGMKYTHDWYSFGYRIRTGDPRKQQDPQLTVGTAFEEFGTLPLGFEKVYFKGEWDKWSFWLGKNDFPFAKNNELFWSDNVFPEGVFASRKWTFESSVLQDIRLSGGHFILSASGRDFGSDAYVQGLQTKANFWNERLQIFPSYYRMKNIADIPDGAKTFTLDYQILHLGGKWKVLEKQNLACKFDIYTNVQDYSDHEFLNDSFKDEKLGIVVGIKKGQLSKKNDHLFELTYAYLERYSALDYMAQNDWARWDYSAFDSPDGRLTNLQGVEFVYGYAISKKMNIVFKAYQVDQLVALGVSKENGSRVRLDLNVKL